MKWIPCILMHNLFEVSDTLWNNTEYLAHLILSILCNIKIWIGETRISCKNYWDVWWLTDRWLIDWSRYGQ